MQNKTTDVNHKGKVVGTSTFWQYVAMDDQFQPNAHCVKTYGLAYCYQAFNMGLAIKAQNIVRDADGLTYDVLALALCLRIGANWDMAMAFVHNADTNLKQFAKTNLLEGEPIEYAREILEMDVPELEAA